MLPSATFWKRAVIARLYLFRHRIKPKNRPRKRSEDMPYTLCTAVKCLRSRANIKCCLWQRYGSAFRSRLYLLRHRTKPKSDRASGVRTSRQKTTAFFAVVCLSVRSSFERGILRADESRPRSSIPSAVLARGKTTYARKRSAQNLPSPRLRGQNSYTAASNGRKVRLSSGLSSS